MKITVYTIKDCAFSKQEKEYLNTNKLQYVEKDLETNKDFLTEMLAVSNNFAGTPVTRVEKDDGTIAVLKGFTKEEFDTTFGFAAAPTDKQPPVTTNETPLTTEIPPTPPAPVPTETPTQPTTDLTNSTNSTNSTSPASIVDPLKSVMDDLQVKAQTTDQPVTPPAITDPTVSTTPTDSPAIPDFPAEAKTTV